MERLSVLSMALLLCACIQPSQGDCACGQSCTMEGGGTGVCFEDGTCAVSIMAVQCPLTVGDVCHSGGIETGLGVNRSNDCPEGSSCRPKAGEMAIGGEVTSTCQLDTLKLGDVCHSGGVETGVGVNRSNDCPEGSSCRPKAGEMAIGGEVTSTCQLDPLKLGDVCHSGGVEIGADVNRSNDCPEGSSCRPKAEEMAIGGEVTSTCQLDQLEIGDVCHSGGVETGPGVDRRNDCPEGSSCRPKAGEMAIGGEVTSTCQLDPLEIGDVCHSGGVETGPGVDRRNDCPEGSSCRPKTGEMAIGGEVTSTCQLDPLKIGDVCYSGGVETGEGVDRRSDCPLGSSCMPKVGEMAIGGEVTSTCQLDLLEIGEVCHSGGVETGEGVDRRNACPVGSSCKPKPGEMAIGGEVTSTCQLDDLRLGDVCKSGGVETGPGVERAHDCPIGSVCSPKDGEMAVGGEVISTCQAHDNPLPLGGICSTSGSLGLSATTCIGDIVCILIDIGRPEIDIPNRGMCLPAGAALPVGATCYKASGSTEAIGAIPCAPSLHCVLSQSSEDPLAMTCQPVNGNPVVLEDAPSTASSLTRYSWLLMVGVWLGLVRA